MELYEQINRIKGLMLNESDENVTVLQKYLGDNQELIQKYTEIENTLGDKFTEDHFNQEIAYSGPLKQLSTGILPDTLKQFNLMKREIPSISIRENSWRDYEKQKETFIKYAKKYGGTISGGLKQAALPGFSQHHTGRAIDVGDYRKLTPQILNKYGFVVSYPKQTSFRIAEPWHIYYTK
jgi:LAS superfamily LD-carboxypeptidase LdcB